MFRLLTLIFVLFSFSLFGQYREERKAVEWVIKSKKIVKATGWRYNSTTGKWISNTNAVYENPALEPIVSTIDQNFNWIQIGKVKNDYETYTLLLYEKQSGFYKHKTIEQGWTEEKRTYWFLIDSVQYSALVKLIKNKSAGEITITTKNHGFIRDHFAALGGEHEYSDRNLLSNITRSIRVSDDINECMKIRYSVDSQKESVRFLLPGESCRFIDRHFEKGYFEINPEIFKSILVN